MSLKGIASETLAIIDRGHYDNARGERVAIGSAVQHAITGTRLYRPSDCAALLRAPEPDRSAAEVRVSDDKTQAAARRLASAGEVALLNFASAKNPGGGFKGGAKAQEEDLARASALYACLLRAPDYYAENRGCKSMLYTDHIIYSPRVPFFRLGSRDLADTPCLASVITAPAPNAGQHLRRHPDDHASIREALERRAGYVLSVARDQGHRRLLLGAWGCGVFRNEPTEVAGAFARWLDDAQFAKAFDLVEFAILDRTAQRTTLATFETVFSGDNMTRKP